MCVDLDERTRFIVRPSKILCRVGLEIKTFPWPKAGKYGIHPGLRTHRQSASGDGNAFPSLDATVQV